MSQTAAPLLIVVVAVACKEALRELHITRTRTLNVILNAKAKFDLYEGLTREEIKAKLGDHELMIPRMHRIDDARRLHDIYEIAVTALGPTTSDLRMLVTLEDFALIRKFYKRARSPSTWDRLIP